MPQRRVLYLPRDIPGVEHLCTTYLQDWFLLFRLFGKLVASLHHKEMGEEDIHSPPVAIAVGQLLPSLLQEQTQLLFALFVTEESPEAVLVGIGCEQQT